MQEDETLDVQSQPMRNEASRFQSMGERHSTDGIQLERGDHAAQRRVVIAAALGWMLDAFDVMLYSIVLTTLMRAFSMSRTTAGLLNALTLIASALGGLLFGVLADRFGRRRMLSASILVYSVFTFACGLSTSIAMLAACRFVLGLGMGGEWNTGAALVAETWPSALRGRALGIVQSSWAVGYAISAVVAGLILAHAKLAMGVFRGNSAGGTGVLDTEPRAGAAAMGASAHASAHAGKTRHGPGIGEGADGADGDEYASACSGGGGCLRGFRRISCCRCRRADGDLQR